LDKIVEKSPSNTFLRKFQPFQRKIASYALWYSLSQTLLKITCPGLPDFYQGSELWDFSLVDPDNRRPIDFSLREKYLQKLRVQIEENILNCINDLIRTRRDGRIKLFLIHQALKVRQQSKELFQKGAYQPLPVEGSFSQSVFAFSRRYEKQWAIIVVPRLLMKVHKPEILPLGMTVWQDTVIRLPDHSPRIWKNRITGQALQGGSHLFLGTLFEHFSVGLLTNG
jgi:(1->4)-alpha-D-glucan 1-alpha-D-glucosylmutase